MFVISDFSMYQWEMNWNHLYCFYEVARCRSIKDASKNLGLAASTISEHVKSLESNINITLLIRSPRDLKLTIDGERIYRYAEKMYATGKRLEDSITSEEVSGYNVKIGIERSLRGEFVDDLLSSYWKNYSRFGLVESTSVKNSSQSIYFLDHEIIDIAISDFEMTDSGFGHEKLATFKNSLFYSSDLELAQLSKNKLAKIPLAVIGNKEVMKKSLKKFLIDNSFSPREVFYTDHDDFAKRLCRDGEILLFMSHEVNRPPLGLKELCDFVSEEFPIYSVYKIENQNLVFMREFKKEVTLPNLKIF